MKNHFATVALALGLGLSLSACSSAEPVDISAETVVLDVRTPEEYANGHLEGALLIDVQRPDFDASIAELDRSVPYLVYCRSGNRSAQAIARMDALGFENLTNLGSVADAANSTGIPVVTGP